MLDFILRLLGENPADFPALSDKTSTIFVDLWSSSFVWLPIIGLLGPWIWFFWHKKRGGVITKKKIIVTVLISLVLVWVGYNLPWWIIEVIGGFAVRGIYGGQI